MYGSVFRGHLYRPRLWPGGRGWFSTCACPWFAIGALLDGWRILMMGRHAWLMLKPSSLLKLSGCSRISIAPLPGGPCIWLPSLTWKHRRSWCGGMLTNALPPLTSLLGSSGRVSYVPWGLPLWSVRFVPRRHSRIHRRYGKFLRSLSPSCPWSAWVHGCSWPEYARSGCWIKVNI
jgi:hypothetical protein